MTLWDLLTLLSGAAAFGAAFSDLKVASNTGDIPLLATTLGVVIAVAGCCIGILRIAGVAAQKYGAERSSKQVGRAPSAIILVRAMYLFGVAWLVVSGILGKVAAQTILGVWQH